MENRKIMSSYHRQRPCEPCCICGKVQLRYDHFCMLSTGEQKFFVKHANRSFSSDSCMCRSHKSEVKRYQSNPEYIPKWSRKETSYIKCNYKECTSSSATTKIITLSEDTKTNFCTQLDTLCETHYQVMYRQAHQYSECACCGAKPKVRAGPYTRHSPDASTVSHYLAECNVIILPTDTICKSCYDMHLVILQNIATAEAPTMQQLQSDITLWKMKLEELDDTDELTKAILTTVIFVATKFEQDKAILLPRVTSFFLANYSPAKGNEDIQLEIELNDGSIKFSSRWLLHRLIAHLQPYMGYKCVVKKLGTLLYPLHSDLLKCLTYALHDSDEHTEPTMLVSQGHQTNPSALLMQAEVY